MRDPVVASDGHSYERKAIEEVLRNSQPRSPLTREPLKADLVPNHALRRRIEDHEVELDRTLEEVASAVQASAQAKLVEAEREMAELRRMLAEQQQRAGASARSQPPPNPGTTLGAGASSSGAGSAEGSSSTTSARRSSKRVLHLDSSSDAASSRKRRGS